MTDRCPSPSSLRSGSHPGGFPEGAEREREPGVPGGAQPAEGAAGRLKGRGEHEGEQQAAAGGPQGGRHKGEGASWSAASHGYYRELHADEYFHVVHNNISAEGGNA